MQHPDADALPDGPPPRTAGLPTPPPAGSAARLLVDEAYRFDFFQAIRLLQRLDPSRSPIGGEGPPGREAVVLRSLASLAFPPSTLHELRPATADRPSPELVQSFFGLTGPSGVLPRHYTELLLRLGRDAKGPERTALRDWLDQFNHRLASLFYRAWAKYRLTVAFEQAPAAAPEPDPITATLFSLIGLGTPGLRGRLSVLGPEGPDGERPVLAAVPDLALLRYAGALSGRVRGAAGLEGLLRDHFGVAVAVESFRGQWLLLDEGSRTALGGRGAANCLGRTAIAGERVWDVQGRFRVRLGPLGYDRFRDFLPDRSPGPHRKALFLLAHLVRLYAGGELDFDVQVVLRGDQVPGCTLGSGEGDDFGFRLGWNTWLAHPGDRDAADAVFEVEATATLDPIVSRAPGRDAPRQSVGGVAR